MLSESSTNTFAKLSAPAELLSRENSCRQTQKRLRTAWRSRLLFSVCLPRAFPRHFSQGKVIYPFFLRASGPHLQITSHSHVCNGVLPLPSPATNKTKNTST